MKVTRNQKARFIDQAITLFDRLPHGAFFRLRNKKTVLQKLSTYGRAIDAAGKVYHIDNSTPVVQVSRKNSGLFGPEAVAAAKRVMRSRTVKDRSTGERGRIIGAGPQGWLKVQWDSRDKPTLIKRSELKLARGRNPLNSSLKNPIKIRRCTSCGQVFGQVSECPMCQAGIGRRNPSDARFLIQVVKVTGGREQFTTNSAKEALTAAASWYSRGAAITLIDRKAKTKDVYPPTYKWPRKVNGITEAAAGLQALEYLGGKVKAGGKPKYKINAKAKGSRDILGVWHTNPKQEFLSSRYYVTGTQRRSRFYLKPDKLATGFPEKAEEFIGPDSAQRAADKENALGVWGFKWRTKRFTKIIKATNPSVSALAEKFQGKADGSVEQMHAASGAPANLARAGKFVFLKVAGRSIRIPGAMVAIAPNEKLWIVGDHAPLFETKARSGEGLDVGEVTHICYETGKAHIENGKVFEYVHEFGEEGGKRPHLIIDSEGMPLLRGGDYKIKAEGIVN